MHGLEKVRGLRKDEIILRVGNGARVATIAVGTYSSLSLRFSLILKDCYYVSIASKNLISVSVLVQDNYNFYFNKDLCIIYFENKVIACIFLINRLYHLYMDASIDVNEKIVNTIRPKRPKDRISQKYLWHLRLGHIGKDRLNKLKKDSLLGPLTSESYLIYESIFKKRWLSCLLWDKKKKSLRY